MNEQEINLILEAEKSENSRASETTKTNEVVQPTVEVKTQVEEPKPATQSKEPEVPSKEVKSDEVDISKQEAIKRIIELKREKQERAKNEVPSFDMESLKAQIKAELETEFQAKLNEGIELKEKLTRLEDEKIYEEFNTQVNKDVADYISKNPHTKGIVTKDFLVKHYEVNPELMSKPFEDVVSMIYKDLVDPPRMDGYSTSKNKPKDLDFFNLTKEDEARIASDPELDKRYTDHLRKYF